MDNNLYYQEWIGNEKNFFRKFLKKIYYRLTRPIHSKVDKVVDNNQKHLNELKKKIENTTIKLEETRSKLNETNSKLNETNSKLNETNSKLNETNSNLNETNSKLNETNSKLNETNSKLNGVITRQQLEKNKTAAIARTLMKVKWQNIDDRTSKIESGSDIIKCIICGHEGRRDSYETKTTKCIFNGGKLVRYVCPECGAIFGPTKFSSLTQGEKDEDYFVHYIGFNESNATYKEKKAFMMLEPSKSKTYLNYGCGRWSTSIQELRKEGYKIYGYEPYAVEDVSNPYLITKKEILDKMKFDGIYSNDVLEHFIDPVSEMKHLRSLLKLPDSKISHCTGCYIYMYEYTRFHTCFFTRKSNEKLAENSGLKILNYVEVNKKDGFICCVYGLRKKEVDYLKNMYINGNQIKEEILLLKKNDKVFGPYLDLDEGKYCIEIDFEISKDDSNKNEKLNCLITSDNGNFIILEKEINNGQNIIHFELHDHKNRIEFVIKNDIYENLKLSKIAMIEG